MTAPALSIVLAMSDHVADRDASLIAARRAIARSAAGLPSGLTCEVIVVMAEGEWSADIETRLAARVVRAPRHALTPVMWGLGLRAASGRIVAFTTSQLRVSSTWAGALLDAIDHGTGAGVVGAGGPIALREIVPNTATDAATDAAMLVRFSAFLPGCWPHVTRALDVPGDNAAYVRTQLLEHEDLLTEGFWEVEFHRRFARAGRRLLMVPAALATAHGAIDLRALRHQRYAHGVSYGVSRVLRHGHRALRIMLAAPVVPLVLLLRIARRARAAGVERARIWRALPGVYRLTTAWAAGEAEGARRAAAGRGNQVTFAHE